MTAILNLEILYKAMDLNLPANVDSNGLPAEVAEDWEMRAQRFRPRVLKPAFDYAISDRGAVVAASSVKAFLASLISWELAGPSGTTPGKLAKRFWIAHQDSVVLFRGSYSKQGLDHGTDCLLNIKLSNMLAGAPNGKRLTSLYGNLLAPIKGVQKEPGLVKQVKLARAIGLAAELGIVKPSDETPVFVEIGNNILTELGQIRAGIDTIDAQKGEKLTEIKNLLTEAR